jgi:hypothetical protein
MVLHSHLLSTYKAGFVGVDAISTADKTYKHEKTRLLPGSKIITQLTFIRLLELEAD